MGQVLGPDNIPPLVKASSTTCTLAATHMGKTTRIRIGGQQYALSGALTLNTATTGLGGLDTGTLSNTHSLYYVYACANTSGALGLVASLAGPSTGPAGFSGRYTLVGAFYSKDSGSQIGSTVTIQGPAVTEWISFTPAISNAGSKVFTNKGIWRRNADGIEVKASHDGDATASGSTATDLVLSSLPSGLLFDLARLPNTSAFDSFLNKIGVWAGSGIYTAAGAINNDASACTFDNNRVTMYRGWDSAAFATTRLRTVDLNVARAMLMTLNYSAPISGWSKTLLG